MIVSVDTNVLVYAIFQGGSSPPSGRALDQQFRREWSRHPDPTDPGAIRKLGTPRETARGFVQDLRAVVDVHPADVLAPDRAMVAVEDHDLSFWDAMRWATARRAGVRFLLGEDFQDRRPLGGVTFVNLFKQKNRQLLERELPAMRPGSPLPERTPSTSPQTRGALARYP